jgi:hypothetical protein
MATLKNSIINDTGYFTLPAGTTAQRPGSPTQGMTRYNTTLGYVEWYDTTGATWRPIYQAPSISVDYLVVAGGGGGGSHVGGGGGGGGFLTGTQTGLSTGTFYTITVGAGGSVVANSNLQGGTGANSVFNNITATGGGGGGTWAGAGNVSGVSGGSGGGAGGGADGSGSATGGTGVVGQGFNGGNTGPRTSLNSSGAGGGGASAAGANRPDSSSADKLNGGAGTLSTILGTPYYFSGGGGPGTYSSVPGGDGGTGGGGGGCSTGTTGGTGSTTSINPAGNGQSATSGGTGGSGATNSGGGGGGGSGGSVGTGGSGGSGIVVVKAPSAYTGTFSAGLTVSTDTTSAPGYKIYRVTAGTGTVTFS